MRQHIIIILSLNVASSGCFYWIYLEFSAPGMLLNCAFFVVASLAILRASVSATTLKWLANSEPFQASPDPNKLASLTYILIAYTLALAGIICGVIVFTFSRWF